VAPEFIWFYKPVELSLVKSAASEAGQAPSKNAGQV